MPNQFRTGARTAAAALGVALIAGCWGGDASSRVPVDGMVIYDKKPLESGSIEFDLEAAEPKDAFHSGAAIRQGQFRLTVEDGLIPGRYQVRIHSALLPTTPSVAEGPAPALGREPAAKPAEPIPARFIARAGMTAEIKSGWFNSLTFVLDR